MQAQFQLIDEICVYCVVIVSAHTGSKLNFDLEFNLWNVNDEYLCEFYQAINLSACHLTTNKKKAKIIDWKRNKISFYIKLNLFSNILLLR